MVVLLGVVLLAGGYAAIRLAESVTTEPSPQDGPVVREAIVDKFDPKSAEFHLVRDGGLPGERVKLTDGRYEEMRVVPKTDPAFVDLDSDGDLDAAMLLEHSGELTDDGDGAWRGMYLWLWQDGRIEPVKWRAGWEWNCSANIDGSKLNFEGGPSIGTELPAMWAFEFVECTDHTPVDTDGDGKRNTIRYPHFTAVEDGYPVRHFSHLKGSNTLCALEDGKDVTVPGDIEPRVVPDSEAKKVSSGHSKIEVADPDRMAELFPRKDNNGFVPAKITWPDGEGGEIETCAWIEWSAVP